MGIFQTKTPCNAPCKCNVAMYLEPANATSRAEASSPMKKELLLPSEIRLRTAEEAMVGLHQSPSNLRRSGFGLCIHPRQAESSFYPVHQYRCQSDQ